MSDAAQTTEYTREELLMFCKAVANIVAADRKVTAEERFHLAALIRETGLSILDEDVSAAVDPELDSPSPIEDVVKPIKNPALRRHLYRSLVEVALSDGLAPEEETRLTKIAELFQLNKSAAQELIKWTEQSIALDAREQDILARL